MQQRKPIIQKTDRKEAVTRERYGRNMKINQNMMAVITNKQLLRTENNLSGAMERLSTGLKINHAKDNPAGIAISNKMQAQIDALDRASQNASDGTSVIQIADGALNEVSDILQRMRELSVQAASDTSTPDDKKAVQDEIEALKEEINRISSDTEYNQKPLLDGTLDTRIYTQHVSRVNISDSVEAGTYKFKIDTAATQTASESGTAPAGAANGYQDNTTPVGVSGSITINGSTADILATDTYEEAYEKIRNAAEMGEANAELTTNKKGLSFSTVKYGAGAALDISFSSKENLTGFVNALGFDVADCTEVLDKETGAVKGYSLDNAQTGKNAKLTIESTTTGFKSTATCLTDGNKITISDTNGFTISFLAEKGYAGDVELEVTDIGTMILQIGANESQNMAVRIPEVSTNSLYLDDLDVTTVTGADRGIAAVDNAIAQVSAVRSKIGAYQNRLDYAVGSLDETGENMTSALSRIQDADMADEMTAYTQYNVLDQAAISVLSQANEIPQQVLQLLRG